MMLLNAQLFVGKFHPLIVHLPIGFLLLAVLLQAVSYYPKYAVLRQAVPFSLLVGCISATLACITGYLLSLSGDYNVETLDRHMWMGIITAIFSMITYLISIKIIPIKLLQTTSALSISLILILTGISFAGHLGGSLTHGSDYLSTNTLFEKTKEKKVISNVDEALVFEDIVHPILLHKCGDCHNSGKLKGQLSIESFQSLVKGGKHGAVLVAGKPPESELIKRVSLDPADKKFMPTDGKPPLTKEETAIIRWWIEKAMTGADKKLSVAAPAPEIKNYILAYFGQATADSADATETSLKSVHAPKAGEELLGILKKAGFVIKQIHYDPDLLDVTLATGDSASAKEKIKMLLQIKDNIRWLNIAGSSITDDQLEEIKQFSNLQRLRLDKNPVTDKGMSNLEKLTSLESINLCHTQVTQNGISALSKIKTLKTVYVWGTSIKQQDSGLMKIVAGKEE